MDSSSSRYDMHFDYHFRHINLSILDEPGHNSTPAAAFHLNFAPRSRTFDSHKYGIARSARLMVFLKTFGGRLSS